MKLEIKILLATVFAVAMAHLEGVVVLYTRRILELSPSLDNFSITEVPKWLISMEQVREAATIIMLVAFAYLVGKSLMEKIAFFLLVFAVWDIFYYISLYVIVGWPSSLTSLDLLFLMPVPWFAPVWLPISVSVLMIIAAGIILGKENKKNKITS